MTTKVALITGCSTGIGLETALAFARDGYRTVASMRNLARAEALQASAAEQGLSLETLKLDVTDDASVSAALADVEHRHGGIDVLVNNAGIGGNGPVERIDLGRAREIFEANFWGLVRTIRAALPGMRARRSGVIINVTSLAARVPAGAFEGFYTASKYAATALSQALAVEVEPFGIRVVCIEPGFFRTAILENSGSNASNSGPYALRHEWALKFLETSIHGATDSPREVADAILGAARDPSTPLQVPVGASTAPLLALFKSLGSFEAWKPRIREIYERVAGPRPDPPDPSSDA